MVVMTEEWIIDKKPYPGLQVFDSSNCLEFFSKETILENRLDVPIEQHYDNLVFSLLHHLVNEPEKMFYLMSVCCEEEVIDACCECLQHNKTFTVSVYNVVCVFLNWGATPQSLGIPDDDQLSSMFSASLAPQSLPNFPTSGNVKAVLDTITDSLSDESGDDADEQRSRLVNILVRASLDERLRQHKFKFHQAICRVLETFSVWNMDKVSAVVERLNLVQMGLQNAGYVCCCLFTSSPRVQDFRVAAVRQLLHSRFGLLPPHAPLHSLLQHLPSAEVIVGGLKLLEIYVLIQLLNTLLITSNLRPKDGPETPINIAEVSASMTLIEGLLAWTSSVHSALMVPEFLYHVEGSLLKEKCVRLKADCVELICVLKNYIKEWQND